MRELAEATMIDERYRVISRIGSGGMADVYCCEDLQLGRQVAVKLLDRRNAQDSEFVERFRREASSAASLSHPNIVAVFDRGEWDGTYYIAMEYLSGRQLKEVIRETGPLDPLLAIDIASQVLSAARFAHQRGVVHRDLKPHNVIIDAEGRVKVTDFGIARAGASEITETGSIIGTVQYLSPEQAQGHAVSPRSDLYSVGVMLYELLTGRLPFDGDSAVTIALKQIRELAAAPSALNPAVSPELDAIVRRALEKNPADRFADAAEFLAALDGERERLRRPSSDRTAEFAAAAAAPPPPPPVAPVYEEPYVWEAEPAELPRDGARPRWPWLVGGALLVAALALALVLLLAPAAKRRVPGVVGQMEAVALTALQNAGFTPVPTQVTTTAPLGLVISQAPNPGATAGKGSIVRLAVSGGPGVAVIPKLVGRSEATAKRQLIKLGFNPLESTTPSTTVPAGRVISVSPQPGQTLPRGSNVSLEISSGPQQTQVPSVVGRTVADATTLLEAAGFQVTSTQMQSDTPAGTVLAQAPGANNLAQIMSTVVLTVAKAPDQIAVPSVVGTDATSAAQTIAAAGLKASQTGQTVNDPTQDGLVLSESPKAATMVKAGSTVTLVVGHFTPPTTTTPPPTTTTPPPTTTTPTTPAAPPPGT
jgi:beta-lactam-binding protein with PASTA domain/predicted Ser/Thr protein kinase